MVEERMIKDPIHSLPDNKVLAVLLIVEIVVLTFLYFLHFRQIKDPLVFRFMLSDH